MDVRVNGPSQCLCLDVTAEADVVVIRLRMGHTNDVLLDDWPFIQISGDVMRCGADQFHAALVSLLVRIGAFERRQKRMVDVYDPPGHLLTHFIRENLHVTGKHDQLGPRVGHDTHLLCFRFGFVVFCHLDAVKRNVVIHYDLLIVHVIRDHCHDINRKSANTPSIQEIIEAVAEARDHNDDFSLLGLVEKFCFHPKARRDWVETCAQFFEFTPAFGTEAHPHEEIAGVSIVKLRAVCDVASLIGKKS
ncbi:hypothetical protein MPL3365_130579 [Mesorhizobium plurifarium]|uniref:Uncharacterized protein n=1 Tax=Mesorhizobium plurifarium TaxID=69974 RepID=A0A090FX11_MESPL|nr:hypothetical protein MPL3365_130579 [Mesorhizobium plurifarium]